MVYEYKTKYFINPYTQDYDDKVDWASQVSLNKSQLSISWMDDATALQFLLVQSHSHIILYSCTNWAISTTTCSMFFHNLQLHHNLCVSLSFIHISLIDNDIVEYHKKSSSRYTYWLIAS